MTLQLINVGIIANDHTGDSFRVGGQKINANFVLLSGLVPLGYASTTISAATNNDFSLGGMFPDGIGRIDITSATVDFSLTGMAAGTDGQPMIIRNISGKTMTLPYENAGSLAANRFTGAGGGSTYPNGFIARCIYYVLPNPRWSVG